MLVGQEYSSEIVLSAAGECCGETEASLGILRQVPPAIPKVHSWAL